MRVNLKSFLLGAVLVVVLFIVIGQTAKQSYPVGRFQVIVPIQETGAIYPGEILLDTKTGVTWNFIPQKEAHWGWRTMPFADTLSKQILENLLDNY